MSSPTNNNDFNLSQQQQQDQREQDNAPPTDDVNSGAAPASDEQHPQPAAPTSSATAAPTGAAQTQTQSYTYVVGSDGTRTTSGPAPPPMVGEFVQELLARMGVPAPPGAAAAGVPPTASAAPTADADPNPLPARNGLFGELALSVTFETMPMTLGTALGQQPLSAVHRDAQNATQETIAPIRSNDASPVPNADHAAGTDLDNPTQDAENTQEQADMDDPPLPQMEPAPAQPQPTSNQPNAAGDDANSESGNPLSIMSQFLQIAQRLAAATARLAALQTEPFEQPPDPKRAQTLLRGLTTVEDGLIRRFERVEHLRAQNGAIEGNGGVVCAVCFDSLRNNPNPEPPEVEVKEEEMDGEDVEMEDATRTYDGPASRTRSKQRKAKGALQPYAGRIIALPCTHLFHAECLEPWFSMRTTCPSCRFDVDPDSLTLKVTAPRVPPGLGAGAGLGLGTPPIGLDGGFPLGLAMPLLFGSFGVPPPGPQPPTADMPEPPSLNLNAPIPPPAPQAQAQPAPPPANEPAADGQDRPSLPPFSSLFSSFDGPFIFTTNEGFGIGFRVSAPMPPRTQGPAPPPGPPPAPAAQVPPLVPPPATAIPIPIPIPIPPLPPMNAHLNNAQRSAGPSRPATPVDRHHRHPYARTSSSTPTTATEPARRKWIAPEGTSLRLLVEAREREVGLRCDDSTCAFGPEDDDDEQHPSTLRPERIFLGKPGRTDEPVCKHRFHPECLVVSARVADRKLQARGVDVEEDVEIACPTCRAHGVLEKEEWIRAVRMEEEAMEA